MVYNKKINIDDFKNMYLFELYFLKYIKSKRSSFNIIIYTRKQDIKTFNYISQIFIKRIEKIEEYLIKRNINIKLINFPFCLFDNEKFIRRYLVNRGETDYMSIRKKENNECLTCDYYIHCLWCSKKEFSLKWFRKNFYLKQEIVEKFEKIRKFLLTIGFEREDFEIIPIVDLRKKFHFIDKKIVDNTTICFIDKRDFFLSWYYYNEKKKYETNLFFKNYIIQKKFDKLLFKLWFSCVLVYNDKNNLPKGISIFVNSDENLLDHYLNACSIGEWRRVKIGEEFKWRLYIWGDKNLSLTVLYLKDIYSIKKDFHSYIVLLCNPEINAYIPYIYKFKYFLSFASDKDEQLTSHYRIIAKEIGAYCIDSIPEEKLFWLEGWDILNVDFNYWIIKRVW